MKTNEVNKLTAGERVLLRGVVTDENGMKMIQVGGVALSVQPENVACTLGLVSDVESVLSGESVALGMDVSCEIVKTMCKQLEMLARSLHAKCGFWNWSGDFEEMSIKAKSASDVLFSIRMLLRVCQTARERKEELGTDDNGVVDSGVVDDE